MREVSTHVDMAQMHGSKDDSAIPDRYFSSAPASRCNSLRHKRGGGGGSRRKAHNMARSNSVSLPDCSDASSHLNSSLSKQKCHLWMVRSFKTTSKGIVDSGSFNKSLSSNSLLSSGSLNTSHGSGDFYSRSFSIEQHRDSSQDSSDESDVRCQQSFSMPSYFRILVLGAPGVGKTSLIEQLTRCDPSTDDDEPRFTVNSALVSVQLDGQESTMEFNSGSDLVDLECYKADAYILMYAVNEPKTYAHATTLLNYLRQDLGTDRTIFLVANKCDLMRQRVVPTAEARKFSVNNECHFLETSTALSVNMDELLIGILCNIKKQLTPLPDVKHRNGFHSKSSTSERRPRSPKRALSAISNFLKQACRRDSRRRDVRPIPQMV